MLIRVAARSTAWVYGRSLAGITGSNSAQRIDVSLLSVVCCQEEVSATDRSLDQRSPTECGVSNLSVNKGPCSGGLGPTRTVEPREKKLRYIKRAIIIFSTH